VTEQAYLDSISSRSDDDYPAVIKISDPLLIRLSPDSLMISDTTFYAKVKYGLAFSGYVIYSSGLGTPIIEVDLTKEYSKSSSSGDNVQRNKDDVLKELVKRAAEFLDKLEARVATSESANVIKESIDRLCWQLHYDITKSKTNFVTAFEDQGFSKSVTSVDGWSDSSTVVGRTLYDYFGWTGTITNNGSTLEYGNGLIGMTEKVAWNLKHDNETYSISKALREDDEVSVSNATHKQTVLEQQHFTQISVNQLGAFGAEHDSGTPNAGTYRTLFDTLNYGAPNAGYSNTDNKSLAMTVGTDVIGSSGTYNKTIIAYDDEISNTKLGKFGIDGFRNLFLTLNDEYSDGNNTTYNGYSNTNFDSLYKAVGDSHSSTLSYKGAIYSKIGTESDYSGDTTLFARAKEISETKLGNFGSNGQKTLCDSLGSGLTSTAYKPLSDLVGSLYTTTDDSLSLYRIVSDRSTTIANQKCFRAYSSIAQW
jgi:hypothetical protein